MNNHNELLLTALSRDRAREFQERARRASSGPRGPRVLRPPLASIRAAIATLLSGLAARIEPGPDARLL